MTVDTRTPTGRRVTRPVYALIVDDSAVELPVPAVPPVADLSGVYALVVDDSAVDLPVACPPAAAPPLADPSGVYALVVDDSVVGLPVATGEPVASLVVGRAPEPSIEAELAPLFGPPEPDGVTGVAVDPRMRARWIAARRAEGRRRLRVLLVCGGFAAFLLVAAGLLYLSPFFDVENVTVTGVDSARAEVVRSVAGVSQGEAVIRVDTDAVARRVETLPWVVHAKVTRSFPDSVHIEVTERRVVAWVGAGPGGSRRRSSPRSTRPGASSCWTRRHPPACRCSTGSRARPRWGSRATGPWSRPPAPPRGCRATCATSRRR